MIGDLPIRSTIHPGVVLGRVTNTAPLRVQVDGEDYEVIPTRTVRDYVGAGWFVPGVQVVCIFAAEDPDQLVVLDAL